MCHARAIPEHPEPEEARMPKAEWGVKRTCPNCEARFYDLQREPITCPECGAAFAVDDHGKVSTTRERRAPGPAAADEEALVDDEDLVEEADEDADAPLLADEDEEEDETGPVLAEEAEEEEAAPAFTDAGLIDDEIDEDVDDEEVEDEIDDLDDLPDDQRKA
jgi:uncharacterized protein (TIGR02300 family)